MQLRTAIVAPKISVKPSTALLAILVVQAAASACVTARSGAASRIREADDKMVEGCTYVGEVYGSGGGPTDVAIENAKTEAFEQAARQRATHVVWNALVPATRATVSGKAYRCQLPVGAPVQ